jgi:hypothetical protein
MALKRSRVRVSLGPLSRNPVQMRGFFVPKTRGTISGKAAIVSKTQNKSIWEDIVEAGREVLREIEEAILPRKPRKPVRVPVPIRNNTPPQDPDYS